MNFSYLRREPGFYRRVFTLALPVVLQNLITTSLGFMDTFMVGLVGQEQMSAVTVANVPIYIIQLIVFGLQSGSRVLISQFWGRGDRESINRVMGIGFFVAGGISTLCALTMGLFPRQVLMLITDNARLVELGTSYIRIVGFSYILNSLSSIYIGMQQSIENPRFGMTVFAISTVCNTVGNYILIFGKLGLPALGITGAAIATFSSRVVELVISLVYALRCKQMPLMPACILRPGKATFRSFVKFSTPVLLNETLWGTGTSLYTVIMGHMAGSTDLISAYTVAGNIDKMVTVAIFGVAAAAAVIVGKEVGMGGKNAYPIGQALTFVAFCTGFGVAVAEQILFWLVLKPHVLPLFSMTAASASLCVTMMICYSISAPLHAFATTGIVGASVVTMGMLSLPVLLRSGYKPSLACGMVCAGGSLGILRGGGDVRIAMLIDVLPLWCFTLPLLVLLGLVLHAPIAIFCFIMATESALKVPFGLHRIRGGKWIHDVTQDLNA